MGKVARRASIRVGTDLPTREGVRYFFEVLPFMVMAVLMAVLSCCYIYSRQLNGPPIRSDGFGYYAYLPSVVIDHNLQFTPALNNMAPGATAYNYGIARPLGGTGYFNKYAVGTAILQSPFFVGAHLAARQSGQPATGYSTYYQWANMLSAYVYMCVGIYFLYASLRSMHSPATSLITVVLTVLGTNVFHYATYDASFSHIYQFALTSLLLYLLLNIRSNEGRISIGQLVAIGVVTGFIVLTRMTNAIFAMLPAAIFFERWWKDRDLRALMRSGFVVGLAALAALSPQLLYWKVSTGHWLVNAYAVVGEDASFHWAHPELINFLFSVRKGAFLWTPALVAAFIGLPLLIRRTGWLGYAMALLVCVHVYVCASWYCWPFGGSYGSRPMVDVMSIMALGLAMVIAALIRRRYVLVLAVSASILMALNLTMMYAYWRQFVPFDGTTIGNLLQLPHLILNSQL